MKFQKGSYCQRNLIFKMFTKRMKYDKMNFKLIVYNELK